MRYRPFGNTGKTVSAVSLALRDTPGLPTAEAWRKLIFAAMENGINCFDLAERCETIAAGMGLALQAVERRLLFLIWTIRGDAGAPLTAQRIADSVREGLRRTGAHYLDVLMLDETAFSSLTSQASAYLEQLRSGSFILQLGLCGEGAALDVGIADPAFDVLAMPYNITSEWESRRLLREAAAQGMVAIGYDAAPAEIVAPPKREPLRRVRREPLAGTGTYAFLHATPGWTAEDLCLCYALTEPSLATIQFELTTPESIETLAAVPERDPPSGLGAQIEMARFGGEPAAQRKQA